MAAILLIILQVGVYKVYTLIPIGIIVVVIIAWIMVSGIFKSKQIFGILISAIKTEIDYLLIEKNAKMLKYLIH